jgi:4-amino-4-deoxy-L-arabinose transferase-like glycosyltransferase
MAYGFSSTMTAKRKEFLFLLVWFVVIFIFFSLSKGKRGLYLLPLFPAVSIMTGKLWEDILSFSMRHFRQGWITISLYLLSGIVFVIGIAMPWIISARFPSYFYYFLPFAFSSIGAAIGLLIFTRLRYYGAIFVLIIGMMAGGFFYTLRVIFPLINPDKSARFICQEITSRIQPGEKVALFGDFEPGPYNFYTGIVPILLLGEEEDFINFLKSPERVFCLIKNRDFIKFEGLEDRPEARVIARRGIKESDLILVSNR